MQISARLKEIRSLKGWLRVKLKISRTKNHIVQGIEIKEFD